MYYLVQNTEIGKYYYKETKCLQFIFTPYKIQSHKFDTKSEIQQLLNLLHKAGFEELYIEEVKDVI